ncbi:MAG: putative tricarboxylic transport rane protein [Petroclostridium sp.]|jgi:putative tricarboxylic transport membrane protein|nr:putative tricarboxylic transport rane protein [Petroclostridium sp.]
MTFKKLGLTTITAALALSMLVSGCGKSAAKQGGQKEVKYPTKTMEFIAPAGAGGGWDLTIRSVAKTLQDTKLVSVPMPVTNKPGGGGGVALSYLQEKKGSDTILSVYSPPLLLINLNGSTKLSYKDTTPIARLIADYGAFAVGKNSKYKTINEVMDALKNNPKSVKIGGTSAAGSMDHLQFLKIAKAAGVKDLKAIDYVSFQDGTASAQLMGGHVDLISVGLADIRALIESGDIKVLATTADKRVGEGVLKEIPTCKEQGINETFVNWRGLFGAPGMPEYAVKYWSETLKKMSETSEWKELCKKNGWDIVYSDGQEFASFLDKTNEEYKALLQEIGMLKN